MSGSRKQGAEKAREIYVNSLTERGIHITRTEGVREVTYKTSSGKIVRIPFANEKTKGDEWWWGLPNTGGTDVIILLARTKADQMLDFVLPSDFFLPIWDLLSKDDQGGVNFGMIDRGRGAIGSCYRAGVSGLSTAIRGRLHSSHNQIQFNLGRYLETL